MGSGGRDGLRLLTLEVGTTAELEASSSGKNLSGAFSKLKESASMLSMRRGANRRALLLHGARHSSVWANGVAMAPAMSFTVCLLQLLLGTGFVAGTCDTPIDPAHRVKELFYVVNPVPCVY